MRAHYFIFHIMHSDGGEWHDVDWVRNCNLQLKCIHIQCMCRERTHSLLIHSASNWPGFVDAVIKSAEPKIKEERQRRLEKRQSGEKCPQPIEYTRGKQIDTQILGCELVNLFILMVSVWESVFWPNTDSFFFAVCEFAHAVSRAFAFHGAFPESLWGLSWRQQFRTSWAELNWI